MFGFWIFLVSKYTFALPLPLPDPPSTPTLILKTLPKVASANTFLPMYNTHLKLKSLCRILSFKLLKKKKKNPPWHKSWGIVKFFLNRQTEDDEDWKAQVKEVTTKTKPRIAAFISQHCSLSNTTTTLLPRPGCLPGGQFRTGWCFLPKETEGVCGGNKQPSYPPVSQQDPWWAW